MHESFLIEFIFSLLALPLSTMECKCLFEIKKKSVCSESVARLTKLSESKNNINDQLPKWHVSRIKGALIFAMLCG